MNKSPNENLENKIKKFDLAQLKVLACPVSGGDLIYDEVNQRLICEFSQLSYPIIDGIPMLLKSEAKPI